MSARNTRQPGRYATCPRCLACDVGGHWGMLAKLMPVGTVRRRPLQYEVPKESPANEAGQLEHLTGGVQTII